MKKTISYGFLIWLIPFLVAFFIFPIHESNRPLFENVMTISATLVTLFFFGKFFSGIQKNYARDGLTAGLIWATMSLVLDSLIFIAPTPLQMPLLEYIYDIGLVYTIIPMIGFLVGTILDRSHQAEKQEAS